MPEPAMVVLALALYTAGLVIATATVVSRRGRSGHSPRQFARERKSLQRAVDRADTSMGLLLCSIEASGVLGLDTDRDEDRETVALVEELRSRFGAEAVFHVAPQQVAILSREGATAVREGAEAVREVASAVGLEGMVTIGSAHGPGRGRGPSHGLWARATTAAHHARQRGGGAVAAYEDIAATAVVVAEAHIDAVQDLLAGQRVSVNYQPIFALPSRDILGFEALSRPDASYELAGPEHAFAAAMRIGRAAELDAVCRAAVLDDAPGLDMPRESLLFLNITPAGLTHPSLAAPTLLPAVRLAGLTPERVVFELTAPSTLDAKAVQAGARQLSEHGFKIALDDLGASHAATDLVGLVPADFLKVHPALLRAAADDPIARSLLGGLCDVAAETGATVIAKGIEQESLLAVATRLGGAAGGAPRIAAAQGHALSAPSPRPQDPDSETVEADEASGGDQDGGSDPAS